MSEFPLKHSSETVSELEELKNTYMTTQSGILEAHVWDLVVQVEAEDRAKVAFIDATADDPSYYRTEPEAMLGVVEMAEGLYEKHVIDANTFRTLISQYEAKRPLYRRAVIYQMIYQFHDTSLLLFGIVGQILIFVTIAKPPQGRRMATPSYEGLWAERILRISSVASAMSRCVVSTIRSRTLSSDSA